MWNKAFYYLVNLYLNKFFSTILYMSTTNNDSRLMSKSDQTLQGAGIKIKSKYYKKKLKQQENRIKMLESQMKQIQPIENKKVIDLIFQMKTNINDFLEDVQKNPKPQYIVDATLKKDRPFYLGLFGIIVFSVYLILKQFINSN
jgi:hypothetical protein